MNGDDITLLYSCDVHHHRDSRVLMGAFESRRVALASLRMHLFKKELPGLSVDDINLFALVGQTQGYAGEGEFYSEEITIGDIID